MKKRRAIFLMLICTSFFLTISIQNVTAQWTSNGPDGGYIKGTARSATTIYALMGSLGNAIYSSTDNGVTWTLINNTLPANVKAIAVMGNSLFIASISGVYRSDDNGITWVNKSAGFPSGISLNMYTLAVSGTTIFAAVQTSTPVALIRSTDNGETWTLQTSGLTCNGINVILATETAIFTGGGSNRKGVFRSTNNGATWQQVTTGMYYYLSGIPNYTSAPNINALGFNGTDLYAGTLNSQGIWKTSDNGGNWVLTNVSTRSNATYSSVIGDGSTVYAGSATNGILRSTDNGANWTSSNTGIDIYSEARSLMVNVGSVLAGTKAGLYTTTDSGLNWTKSSNGIHAYQMAIPAIAVSGSYMFAGTNTGGVFRSSDEGNTWAPVNNGLPVNVASEFPSVYAGSSLLYSNSRISSDNGDNWTLSNSPGSAGDQSPLPWIEHGTGFFAISSVNPGVYRSMDNGANWVLVTNGIDVGSSLFVSIYSDGTTLYLGNDFGYYYSSDNGDNWIPGVFPNYSVWSFYTASFIKAGSAGIMGLRGGGGQQGIFRSIDNGANWTQVSDFLVHKLLVSGSKIWASGINTEIINGTSTLVPAIFLSLDNGQNWSKVSGALSNVYTLSIAAEGDNVYVATSVPDYGVYRSSDNGTTWANITSGLSPQVTTLNIANGKLFAGTSGNSVWQRNLTDFTAPSQPSAISGSATPCIGSTQTYSVTNVPGTTYTWQLPSGWVITAGGTTNSVTVTVGSSPGIILVTPSNAFGMGPAQYIIVSPDTNPPAQPSIISGSTNPLEGDIETYSVTNDPGVSYAWTFPTGWVQTGGGTTNSVTVTVGSGSGDITVTPSTLCGTGTPRTLAVVPTPLGFTVTFNVDMSTAEGFVPGTDLVYLTGNFPGASWVTPGDPGSLVMTQVGSTLVYTYSMLMDAGSYEYKYFKNAGWGGGEYAGGPNRLALIAASITINDTWGGSINWANLQWPGSGTIDPGGAYDVYAQANIPNGITSVEGLAYGLQAWIGYSTGNTDPSTWTNWVAAPFFNQAYDNDEFKVNLGAAITTAGTYYYASRFQFGAAAYVYGGFNGGFWNGTTNISGVLTVAAVVPEIVNLENVVVADGQTTCYGALQTIYVAGNNTTFTVQTGGSATMIAGQNIVYLPGTMVEAGGYMHGYISTVFCTNPSNPVVTSPVQHGDIQASVPESMKNHGIRIYPNPAASMITLELTGSETGGVFSIEIYSLSGLKMLSQKYNSERKQTVSVADLRPGVYFVQVTTGTGKETLKLIKL